MFCAGAVNITCMLYIMSVDTHGLYMSHDAVTSHWLYNSQTSFSMTVISSMFFQGVCWRGRVLKKGGSTAEMLSFPHGLQRLRRLGND